MGFHAFQLLTGLFPYVVIFSLYYSFSMHMGRNIPAMFLLNTFLTMCLSYWHGMGPCLTFSVYALCVAVLPTNMPSLPTITQGLSAVLSSLTC